MTILLEGLMKFNENLKDTNLDELEADHIEALAPWFNSLRFNMFITEYDKQINEEQYKHFYCKVILKKVSEYTMYFKLRNIQKDYTFFLNPLYGSEYPAMDINNIYSVLFLGDRVFKVQFKMLNETNIVSNLINEFTLQ
jgi:hypothetical protein